MQCLHYHIARGLSRVYPACYRLRVSHLHRLPLHLIRSRRFHAVRALYAQAMLYLVHGNRIQVSNLQEECRENGPAVAEVDFGNRESAHA